MTDRGRHPIYPLSELRSYIIQRGYVHRVSMHSIEQNLLKEKLLQPLRKAKSKDRRPTFKLYKQTIMPTTSV